MGGRSAATGGGPVAKRVQGCSQRKWREQSRGQDFQIFQMIDFRRMIRNRSFVFYYSLAPILGLNWWNNSERPKIDRWMLTADGQTKLPCTWHT